MAQHNPFATPELQTFYGGALPSPLDPRDFLYPRYRRLPAGVWANHDLRAYHGQSLAMPIGDQGQVGSCTAWAWGYYLRGALAARWHVDNGTQPDLPDTLVPRFLYDLERGPQYLGTYPDDSGADMRTGGQILLDVGIPPERDCPYTGQADNGPLEQELTPTMREAAAYYALSGYYRLQGTGQQLVESIVQCLAEGYPCVIAVLVPPSFEQVGDSGRVPTPRASDRILGAHAVCVLGNFMDNSFGGGGALLIPNSWSSRWGQQGWGYLPFSYATTRHSQYGAFLMEAWTGR
jgi:hypothetical protein